MNASVPIRDNRAAVDALAPHVIRLSNAMSPADKEGEGAAGVASPASGVAAPGDSAASAVSAPTSAPAVLEIPVGDLSWENIGHFLTLIASGA
jgi:hypothetical protein